MGLLVSLSALKKPLGVIVGLHVIPPVLGLCSYLSGFWKAESKTSYFKDLFSVFIPLYLLLFWGFLSLLFKESCIGFLRLVHVFALSGFSLYLVSLKGKSSLFYKQYSKVVTILAFIVLIFEMTFLGSAGEKSLFGYVGFRYEGLFGESNYSSIVLLIVMILHYIQKRLCWSIITGLLCIPLLSRGLGLSCICFSILLIVYEINRKAFKIFSYLMFILLAFTPLWVLLVNWYADQSFIFMIEKLSAGRYFLWLPYIQMGLDNVFGVGFFQGEIHYAKYLAPHLELVDEIRGHQINQQHSLFIQVFSEFGVVGYLLLIWQFFVVLWKCQGQRFTTALFCGVLVGFSFLNGLTDYNLFFTLGFALGQFKEDL